MKNETAIRIIDDLDFYLQNHTDDYGEANHAAMMMAIEALKTRPTGEWILLEDCSNSGYYCNQCNKKVVKEGWSDTVKKICPNCGSYNGGEQE